MKRKKRPKPFRAVTAVKSAARAHIGMPPPTRREDKSKKKDPPKHKPSAAELLSGEE